MNPSVEDLEQGFLGIDAVEKSLEAAMHPGDKQSQARLASAYAYLNMLKRVTAEEINKATPKPTKKVKHVEKEKPTSPIKPKPKRVKKTK